METLDVSNLDLQELDFSDAVAIEGGHWVKWLFEIATYADAANDFVDGFSEGWNAPR